MTLNPNGKDCYAIIAGNGRFPFLVLEAAREQAIEPDVFAIQEEASVELAKVARAIHWLSLGEIAKLLDTLSAKGVNKVLLAGQVKHVQLFSSIQPDSTLRRALGSLERKNTDSLAEAGTLTRRAPDPSEQEDIAYGREIAKQLAQLDIGQTIVVSDRACLAVEAMEGTDAAIERAARLSNGRRLVVVKVSKPRQDMRFDVPVIGPKTMSVMGRSNARALTVDAGKTLVFERARALEEADRAGIAVVGVADGAAQCGL